MDPIYHQPAELARSWQTCRIAVLEEKVRVMQYEQKVNELQDKINNLEAKISAIHSKEPIMQTTPVSELSPGVEGHWVVIHNAVIPNDAMTTLADGNIRSHLDYVGRTRSMDTLKRWFIQPGVSFKPKLFIRFWFLLKYHGIRIVMAFQTSVMMLLIAFITPAVTSQKETKIVEEVTCSDQLNECEQNLNPIYHKPNELLKAWQNCRTSAIENKLRIVQLETQAIDYKKKFDKLKAEKEDILQGVMQKMPGVEGLWLPLKENGEMPAGALISLHDDTIKANRDIIGRGKLDGKDDRLLCRAIDNDTCWAVLVSFKKFEVLIDNNYKWKWTNFLLPVPENAVIGGYRETESGWELLYIGRAVHFEFSNRGFNESYLLVGQVEGKSRKLVHRAWGVTQSNTYYQILIAP
ncbi:hypothetical protein B566_EDAN002282 [Ephemera danica]|nr:hypothetical protein B566_EDAN002282 [Ephemera danica]